MGLSLGHGPFGQKPARLRERQSGTNRRWTPSPPPWSRPGKAARAAGTSSSGAPIASTSDADAIVVGAGPNGLVAANKLADAGWDVLVLEAEEEPGGAVRSAELIEPGFVHDVFSSFYPLAAFSPAIGGLDLET
jgi:hypothetical protein